MPEVQLPETFFKKERDTVYSYWQRELFRELFQNSLDAGANKIFISIEDDNSGCRITFEDDGEGMTREILENVYFKLGETTKNGEETGGFGRARILTNFSMDCYRIETLDNLVIGKGAYYDIQTVSEIFHGCRQTLVTSDASLYEFENGLRTFLDLCDLSVEVYLNGSKMDARRLNVDSNYIRDLTSSEDELLGKLHYLGNDVAPLRGVGIIRVKGSHMFTQYLGCEGLVILELEPSNSRKILNASRNSFQGLYSEEINKIFQEFVSNEATASKKNSLNELRIYKGFGIFKLSGAAEKQNDELPPAKFVEKSLGFLVASLSRNEKLPKVYEDKKADIRLEKNSETSFTSYVGDWVPDVSVRVRTDDPDLIRLSEFWNPKVWEFVVVGNTVKWGMHKDKISLLHVWNSALQSAFEALQMVRPGISLHWSSGFLLTNNGTVAQCEDSKDSIYRLLINPYTKEKSSAYNLSLDKDLKRILAVAKHEVCHTLFMHHGENYSILHTDIDSVLNQARCVATMKRFRV